MTVRNNDPLRTRVQHNTVGGGVRLLRQPLFSSTNRCKSGPVVDIYTRVPKAIPFFLLMEIFAKRTGFRRRRRDLGRDAHSIIRPRLITGVAPRLTDSQPHRTGYICTDISLFSSLPFSLTELVQLLSSSVGHTWIVVIFANLGPIEGWTSFPPSSNLSNNGSTVRSFFNCQFSLPLSFERKETRTRGRACWKNRRPPERSRSRAARDETIDRESLVGEKQRRRVRRPGREAGVVHRVASTDLLALKRTRAASVARLRWAAISPLRHAPCAPHRGHCPANRGERR